MKKLLSLISLLICFQISLAQDKEADATVPDIPGVILMDFGFNFYQNSPAELNINWFKSKSFGLYYMRSFEVAKKITFNPAVGISFEKYGFSNHSIGYPGNTAQIQIIDLAATYDEVSKSQLAMNYLDIPIQFRYYFTGNSKEGGTYLALGGMASLLLESHTKVKFKDAGRDQTEKKRDDFRQNALRYGVQARFGFGDVNFFYKHYFSNIFKSNGPAGTANLTSQTIGISIQGL